MSSGEAGVPQDPAHIADVDVDESTKGDGFEPDLVTDSGLEINSSGLAEDVTLSELVSSATELNNDGDVGETKVAVDVTDTGVSSPISSSGPSSPGGNTSDNVSNFEEHTVSQQDDNLKSKECTSHKLSVTQNEATIHTQITMDNTNSASNDSLDSQSLDTNKNLATSTVSLNDTIESNVTINKSPYSRSAENISMDIKMDQSVDKDAVLSQFKSQKNKVSATQAIPDTNTNTNLDVRYTRLPKELLSQDLGSIVKNVHGIFSSVSGSLKNAYTHRAGPYMKTVKPMPNGKVMNDIFEDEQHEEKITNGIEAKEISNETETLNMNLEDDVKGDVLRLQLESLERVLAELRKENTGLRETVKQQADKLMERDQTFRELETKMDLMSKRVEQAEREKDAAVMRYASVERTAIEARKMAEQGAVKERVATAEAELAAGKLRAAREDKLRVCQLYDDKCHELANSERELAKVREELKELEGRLKWTQSKLRMEMDAYKDSAERVEKLTAQVAELEAAAAGACDSHAAKQMETELKESMAALILCRHERESLERRLAQTTQLLETTTKERDTAAASNASNLAEIEQLKLHNARLEEEAAELAALRAQAALADTLSAQLHRESERASAAEEALERSRARAATCARREAAALEHAARLTAQQVAVQQQRQHTDDQAAALSADNSALRERISELEAEVGNLQTSLAEEAERRHKESRVLARKVAELQQEAAEAAKQLEWEKGENGVLKKKHASQVKELNRELARALKRVEALEAKQPPTQPSTRTGSVTSLSSGESAAAEEPRLNGHDLPDVQVREPDRQALVERIVSLQRAAARRAERCEFLEEHARQLTDELRGKSRLLRHLLPNLPAQALASTASDSNKPPRRLTKKEIAKFGGGAMAALWGGDPGGLSLELSLEMNKRLQSVLEDTLLKNITLKENMDTLGEEIARLKAQKNVTNTK
ncbi:coiled-coil domain-containing protein 186 isoform X2 [Leguminivora glycinivorella]|uniref:coiled-coil domain-containing protein 186 isoform X2 n=1 Tax=Leguminivora glycinivorella TaxID=1035111 RepID=UPI00200EFC87|nr:coiled-coil domain-containing protein 186 isoform X2 [Leguminivora glycinivorella]